MHTRFTFFALMLLLLCSCSRTVWTENPAATSPDNSDLSLAGEWTLNDPVFGDQHEGESRMVISGPGEDGVYKLTLSGGEQHFGTTFAALDLPDDSGYALIQADLSTLANGPCHYYTYAAFKDGWLFVRRIDSEKLRHIAKREKIAAVLEHSAYSTKVSADPPELIRIFKDHAREISDEDGVYRRLDADSTNKSDNKRMQASGNTSYGVGRPLPAA